MKLLIIKPLVISIGGLGVWILLRFIGIGEYIQGDEGGAMPSGTIAFLAMAYALFAGFLFLTVWSQWVAIEEAVRNEDQAKFILNKDKRIPGTAKMLLLSFSSFLVCAFYLLYFKNALTGGFSIFTVLMVVSTYWQVIMDLDDPFTGVWNVQVPKGWKEK